VSDFHARHEGLLNVEKIEASRILLLGGGSLGSLIATFLVRSGVRFCRVVDHDTVSESNLVRTTYRARDVGRPKVKALAESLSEIRSGVQVVPEEQDLRQVSDETLVGWIEQSDLVLAVTDSPRVQGRVATLSYHRRPALFAGVYERGIGGEVFFTMPDETPCYHCIVGAVRGLTPSVGKLQYGLEAHQLVSEPALGIDIARVAVSAAKIALSLLLRGEPCAPAELVSTSRTIAFVGNSASWSWQWPMETLWGRAERKEDCLCRLPLGASSATLASTEDPDGLDVAAILKSLEAQ